MKSLALALLLGVASSTSLNNEQTIWDETETGAFTDCEDHWTRWSHKSNSWDTFQNAFLGNTPWVDTAFDADWSSIYASSAPPSHKLLSLYQDKIKGWKRPWEIYPGEKLSLWGKLDQFQPHGIKQGYIGDCWFLAAAAALAENPTNLYQAVHTNSRQDYIDAGIFRYNFYVYDRWVPINIDDRLPVQEKYSSQMGYHYKPFASDRSQAGAWWMPMLEKAFAKFISNYDRLTMGVGQDALRYLTGKPVFIIWHHKIEQTQDEVFKMFQKYARQKYAMVSTCCQDEDGIAPDGLTNRHAYSLLDVVEIPGGHRLAKLRNPWSIEKYTGEWSDSDPRWTPDLLDFVGHNKANDGIFFMPFQNYLKYPYFTATDICITKQFTKSKIFYITQKVQMLQITIDIPSTQVVYITIETIDPRYKQNCPLKETFFLDTLFYQGTKFPTKMSDQIKTDPIGKEYYHTTLGEPDMVYQKGPYTLWNTRDCRDPCAPVTYTMTVQQLGYGEVSIKY